MVQLVLLLPSMRASLGTILFLNFFGLCVSALVGLLQIEHWGLQLFSHFLFQYTWLFILFGMLFFIFKKKVFAILSILFAIILLTNIWPAESNTEGKSQANTSLSILSINLLSSNTDADKVNQRIAEKDADILLLIEYTSFWNRHASVKLYPYSIVQVREDNFGIGLFSKYPLTNQEIIDFTNTRFPMTSAEITIKNQKIEILGVHYENPIGQRQTDIQKFQIQETIAFAQGKDNFIIVGDFNLTPYTRGFSRLLYQSSLKDSRIGFGIQGSWPTFWSAFMHWCQKILISSIEKLVHQLAQTICLCILK